MKLTEVAAAVIERRAADGVFEFLLGQRAPGTFYPGYWEFPGGKVESGETPHAALLRELGEELGIGVTRADPWLRREHVYEHAHVRLNFFRVRDWCGELHDHVHSALAWQRADGLTVAPMLPANAPVLAALALPDFCAITHAGEKQFIVELAPDVQITVLKGSVARKVLPEDEEFEFTDEADDAADVASYDVPDDASSLVAEEELTFDPTPEADTDEPEARPEDKN